MPQTLILLINQRNKNILGQVLHQLDVLTFFAELLPERKANAALMPLDQLLPGVVVPFLARPADAWAAQAG
jgi:hypothetical protein